VTLNDHKKCTPFIIFGVTYYSDLCNADTFKFDVRIYQEKMIMFVMSEKSI